ncbi:MAG TPA: hypothetical protein VGM86_31395 [Thermoanaerobaculia bacterium]|jgi:uncharacterized membrane protein YphA (DoxX/SURF4 family)
MVTEPREEVRWSPATRIAFRFFFSYFVLLFVSEGASGLIPGSLVQKHYALWLPLLQRIAGHVLHLEEKLTLEEAGVNNMAFGWTLFLCYMALTAVATVLWSALDRKRAHYERLYSWLRLLLRLILAPILIYYGAIKVIPAQMISPLPVGVMGMRIGDLFPNHLLWWTVGASSPFETFIGTAELVGGVLLLVPRTVLLGALLCAGNMSLVLLLNLCYDVPVKLMSLHFLVMALILIAPDAPRLAGVFFFNRKVEPVHIKPLFARKWLDRAPHVALLLFGLWSMYGSFQHAAAMYKSFHPPRSPLYGFWSVEEIAVDGRAVPMHTVPDRWRWVMILKPGSLSVQRMDGSWTGYKLDLDRRLKILRLWKSKRNSVGDNARSIQGSPQAELSFQRPDPDLLLLEGELDGHPARARLRKTALASGGFHWIAEP